MNEEYLAKEFDELQKTREQNVLDTNFPKKGSYFDDLTGSNIKHIREARQGKRRS